MLLAETKMASQGQIYLHAKRFNRLPQDHDLASEGGCSIAGMAAALAGRTWAGERYTQPLTFTLITNQQLCHSLYEADTG
jgi:hypothetical protein